MSLRSYLDHVELVKTGPSLGERLEQWEMNRKIRKFGVQPPEQGDAALCADWCKGHYDSHKQRILAAFTRRLQEVEGTIAP